MANPRLSVDNNHDFCPICKGDPKNCPHSLADMSARIWENYIRSIVRDEIQKQRTSTLRARSGVG